LQTGDEPEIWPPYLAFEESLVVIQLQGQLLPCISSEKTTPGNVAQPESNKTLSH